MAKSTVGNQHTKLTAEIHSFRKKLETQIARGKGIAGSLLSFNVEQARLDENRWVEFVREILRRSFSSEQYEQEFWGAGAFGTTLDDSGEQAQVLRERIRNRVNALESILERLDLEEPTTTDISSENFNLSAVLHPEIDAKCRTLFETAHYTQAIELSFKVVRDRLRALTGHERGADAFGKTKLHIKGAMAQNVDRDFNEGAKFLTMAIDMFRNEKSHTSESGVDDPTKALQYLVLSSLAMRLLDNAEILA